MSNLVKDEFSIDEDELYCKSKVSGYWSSADKFFGQVKDQPVSSLSDKQKDWLDKIEKGLKED